MGPTTSPPVATGYSALEILAPFWSSVIFSLGVPEPERRRTTTSTAVDLAAAPEGRPARELDRLVARASRLKARAGVEQRAPVLWSRKEIGVEVVRDVVRQLGPCQVDSDRASGRDGEARRRVAAAGRRPVIEAPGEIAAGQAVGRNAGDSMLPTSRRRPRRSGCRPR